MAGKVFVCFVRQQKQRELKFDNPAISMFFKMDFVEEYRTEKCIMLKKIL